MKQLLLLAAILSLIAGDVVAQPSGNGGPGPAPQGYNANTAINVTSLGAVCDGTTDDYPAFNAAANLASSGRVKSIFVPASSTACILSHNITLPTGATLWAYPSTATIKPTSGNTSTPVLINMGTNTLVYGLVIDGGGATFGTSNNIVQAFEVSNAVLDHVTVQNTHGIGYLLSTSISNSGVRDSIFNNIGNFWSTLTAPTLTTNNSTSAGSPTLFFASTSGVVVGHTVLGTNIPTGATVLSIVPNTSVTLSANVLTGGVANSATIQFVVGSNFAAQAVAFCCGTTSANTDNFVRDSYFTNIGLDSISFGANTRPFISGNHAPLALTGWFPSQSIGANGNGAVYVTSSVDPFIVNNDFSGATGNGIDLFNNTGNLVAVGNRSTGNGAAGLSVAGQSACTISGNVLKDNNKVASLGVSYSSTANSGLTFSGTTTNCAVAGNAMFDDQGSPTQVNGIQATGLTQSNLAITGSNMFSGNVSGAISSGIAISDSTKDNRIINPCFAIDSQNEGAAYGEGGGSRSVMDGWTAVQSFAIGSSTRSAGTTFPGCGALSYLLTLQNSSTPTAGQINTLVQNIEGSDMQDLQYGTANAQPLVFDFCAKASVTGTYIAGLHNNTGPRSFLVTFPLTANTNTCYSYQIPGDTASAVSNGTSYQMSVTFDFGSGSNYQTSSAPGSWVAGSYYTTTTAPNFGGNPNGSTFNISGVRLYRGVTDIGWTQRPLADELVLTQRRYRKTFPAGTAVAQNAGVAGAVCTKNPIAAGDPSATWAWGAPMRASPTITTYNPSAANANWRDVTASADATISVDPATALSPSTGVLFATSGTVATLGDILCVQATADAR